MAMASSSSSSSPQSLLWKMALLSTFLVSLMGFSFLALKSPFHPQDLLPLLPRQVSWPILNSLHSAVDILPVFVGSASASSIDDSLEWKGACFYKNKAWMVFHNKSQSEFGGGTLHIKVSNAHSWTCIDLYIFATPYHVTWDYYFLGRELTLEFKEWEGRAEYEYVKNHGVSIFLMKAGMLGTLQALWEGFPLFTNDSKKVQKWRSWHFRNDRYEYKTIQRIVELVSKSLPRYDVFLSFRGRDTRQTFTGYLYNALCKKGLKTFMDDEALEGGEQISQSLINAIEESRLSIIVFSENYAYSSWCLDELVKILECMKMKYHLVWPIFYKVEPLDVMHQKNSYGEAMAAHENRYRDDSEKVQKWRSALYEVSKLEEAWHFQTGYEYEVIDSIVEEATMILNRLYIPSPCWSVN